MLQERRDRSQDGNVVSRLADITADCVITPASRVAMAANLSDGSTETFWESGDEDRTRSRQIMVEVKRRDESGSSIIPHLLAVHVDNIRDLNVSMRCLAREARVSFRDDQAGRWPIMFFFSVQDEGGHLPFRNVDGRHPACENGRIAESFCWLGHSLDQGLASLPVQDWLPRTGQCCPGEADTAHWGKAE